MACFDAFCFPGVYQKATHAVIGDTVFILVCLRQMPRDNSEIDKCFGRSSWDIYLARRSDEVPKSHPPNHFLKVTLKYLSNRTQMVCHIAKTLPSTLYRSSHIVTRTTYFTRKSKRSYGIEEGEGDGEGEGEGEGKGEFMTHHFKVVMM